MNLTIAANEPLQRLLERHPAVSSLSIEGTIPIRWSLPNGWQRATYVGDPSRELMGLVELTDNNPLVCGDEFSVPDAASTLALIAVGPLARSGLMIEAPTMLTNAPVKEDLLEAFLATEGWTESITASHQEMDLSGVYAATVICAVQTPGRLEDFDDLFDERYSRSLYVRKDDAADWHARLVLGKPFAMYRLRIAPDHPHSLLTVQVMADAEGKCGAAQLVHAFNVMSGFEESQGLV